jgi:hypothetical protein
VLVAAAELAVAGVASSARAVIATVISQNMSTIAPAEIAQNRG